MLKTPHLPTDEVPGWPQRARRTSSVHVMLHDARLSTLNDQPERAAGDRGVRYVLYWMQQAQRVRSNHALEHAIAARQRAGPAGRRRLRPDGRLPGGHAPPLCLHARRPGRGRRRTSRRAASASCIRRGASDRRRRRAGRSRRRSSSATGAISATKRVARRRWRKPPAAGSMQVESDVVVPIEW